VLAPSLARMSHKSDLDRNRPIYVRVNAALRADLDTLRDYYPGLTQADIVRLAITEAAVRRVTVRPKQA